MHNPVVTSLLCVFLNMQNLCDGCTLAVFKDNAVQSGFNFSHSYSC